MDRLRNDAWSTAVARTKALLATAREAVADARNQRNIAGLRRAIRRRTAGKQ